MTLSLADGPLELAENPAFFEDDQLSGGFGRFLRLGAGVAAGFLPEKLQKTVGTALTGYAASPEFRPRGGGGNPAPSPQFDPGPNPYSPAPYAPPGFPVTTASGFLTPKNLMIGGGVILGGVLIYSLMGKKRR